MCDENNDCDDIHVPIHLNNANIDCVDNGVEKVVDIPSENNCIIEDVDNAVNFLNPYDLNDSDSFDSSDDDENCFDTCDYNAFVSLNDNDGFESFTFGDESLSNELTNDLHEICGDDDVNIGASLNDLNDIEFVNFHNNCLDDAIYIHDLLGEEKEETDGDLRDVLLSREKEEEKESVTIEKKNEEENFENKNVMIEEVHCKIIEEEEEKTRNESVREEVEDKVRNDKKEFGEKKKNEKTSKLEENGILVDMDSCQSFEESMLRIELKEFANARHVRAYREERVDGAKGLVPVQVCWNEGLKVASGYGR
nr:hypothetical protein Iba_scaffold67277CG0010 [Ipomoea batatas]